MKDLYAQDETSGYFIAGIAAIAATAPTNPSIIDTMAIEDVIKASGFPICLANAGTATIKDPAISIGNPNPNRNAFPSLSGDDRCMACVCDA